MRSCTCSMGSYSGWQPSSSSSTQVLLHLMTATLPALKYRSTVQTEPETVDFSISRLQSCHALPDLHEFWAKDILPHVVFRHVAIICHAFLVLLAFAM